MQDFILGNANNEVLEQMQKHFIPIINALHNDLVIVDKDGNIVLVLPSFEDFYGFPADKAITHTIYDLEDMGILTPSVAANALKSCKEECMLQKTLTGKYLLCYATPVFDKNNNLIYVLSYSRDNTNYEVLKKQFEYLNDTINRNSCFDNTTYYNIYKNDDFSHIIGNGPRFQAIKETLSHFSKFDANVLLTGKSGVGKTLYAKSIHMNSSRKDKPFVHVNCGAIPDTLFESELFGYEKGAFTGANQTGKTGLIECSNGGTLFLDEIADMPLPMQVKLLKVLDTHTITKIGGAREIPVDFRLITATNKNLEVLIEQGGFREDLFFRLNLLYLNIPPLHEHPEDIPSLINHFVDIASKKYNVSKFLSSKAISAMMAYEWPGNIRELENIVERLCIMTHDEVISYEHLPPYIKFSSNYIDVNDNAGKTLPEILNSVEKKIILDTYKKYKSTVKVAEVLGISQPSVSVKLKKYSGEDMNKSL